MKILAAIDADYFCYALGSLKENGEPMKWPFVKSTLDGKIKSIITNVEADDHVLYLSGPNNFRDKICTIQPYKGNRLGNEKPHHYQRIKDYLSSGINWRVEISDGYEADDLVSIAMYERPDEVIGCHIDKDIDMVPGKHYDFIQDIHYEVSELEGLRWFYTQLLMGDPVDNIPGLMKCGKVMATNLVADLETEYEMFEKVRDTYIKWFGSYWETFLTENARLLWMLRTPDDIWEVPNGEHAVRS